MNTFDSLREGVSPECPSELQLDRYSADELEAPARLIIDTHAQGCTACQGRLAGRTRGWDALPVDPRAMLAAIRRAEPAPRAWWKAWAPVAAVFAFVLVVALSWWVKPSDTTRIKGGSILKVFRFEQGGAREVESGTSFAPGDRLRFVVSVPSAGSMTVVGVDARRSLYVAWPRGENEVVRAGEADVGRLLELPGAVALDDSHGSETLYLVHCPGRAEVPLCVMGSAPSPECPAGCTLTSFDVKKP